MTVYEKLSKGMKRINVPFAYSNFNDSNKPDGCPYAVYLGNGADTLTADNKVYWSSYLYTLEYYYDMKDEGKEQELENMLTDQGFIWSKSVDTQIPEQNLYVIYYEIKES